MPSLGPTNQQPTTSNQRTATKVAGVGVNGKQSGNSSSKDTKTLGSVCVWKTGKKLAVKLFDNELPNNMVYGCHTKDRGKVLYLFHKYKMVVITRIFDFKEGF